MSMSFEKADNTGRFTGKADSYAKARPTYPAAAVDYICGEFLQKEPKEDIVYADVGAGTGKFSVLIAGRGKQIYSVEPNQDMREQLARVLAPFTKAHVMNGTAEATTLPDRSIDVVTAAQALHWFDLDLFRTECQRILKPGGQVVVVYNSHRHSNLNHIDKLAEFREKRPLALTKPRNQACAEFFGENLHTRVFDNRAFYNREDYLRYMLSHSYSPTPGDEDYELFVRKVGELFTERQHDGKVRIDFVTEVFSGKLDN